MWQDDDYCTKQLLVKYLPSMNWFTEAVHWGLYKATSRAVQQITLDSLTHSVVLYITNNEITMQSVSVHLVISYIYIYIYICFWSRYL